MNFPKHCILPEGSVYVVTFKDIKWDWIETVKQFDDLTEEEQQKLIDDFDDEQAETWWNEQCVASDIIRLGKRKGIDKEVRKRFLSNALYGVDGWASEFEVE